MKARLEVSDILHSPNPSLTPWVNVIIDPESTDDVLWLAKLIGRKFELERREGCDGFTIRLADEKQTT